jgi:tRNA 2-selenouridine synthase SelU
LIVTKTCAQDFTAFVEEKRRTEGSVVVLPCGKTLAQVLREANISPSDGITVDRLEVMGDYQTYKRFDKFNDKYSPFKSAALRTIFLKSDNHLQGRYFAELTQKCISRLEAAGSTFAEVHVLPLNLALSPFYVQEFYFCSVNSRFPCNVVG